MTLLTGRRCGCTTAESSFTKLCRKLFAYGIHGIDHLIQRDELGDTGQRHFGCDKGIGNTGCITVLAGIFHQAAYRVTYKTEHIHKNGGSRIGTLQRSAAKKFHSSRSSHCGSDSDLSLTSANSTGNCGVSHGKIADRACIK